MAKVDVKTQIKIMFEGLNNQSALNSFPERGLLKDKLSIIVNNIKKNKNVNNTVFIDKLILSHFATASIEMWHRSLHSFLISASLTKASPIWSSVSGYYSSHYSVRAFAHLLGYFQLHLAKRIIQIEINGSQYLCNVIQKNGNDREHKFYWKIVKESEYFANDPFFKINDESTSQSDSGHRNLANYLDHINNFPNFEVLSIDELKNRIKKISRIEYSDAPIPNTDSFPDLNNVQLTAYHRMVRFRSFLDNVLINKNRFWMKHRDPIWCSKILNYQVTNPEYTTLYK